MGREADRVGKAGLAAVIAGSSSKNKTPLWAQRISLDSRIRV